MSHSVKKTRNARPSDPIGVFDSGVGGLSTLRYLQRLMPHERFVFVADQSYVPYGEKTPRQLQLRCARVARFLAEKRVKLIVVACNTATCYAVAHLRSHFALPFIGTVPAVKTACLRSTNGSVAVLSTPATSKSPMLKALIKKSADQCRVIRIGCAGLEEAVEEGSLNSDHTRELVHAYVSRARKAGADQIVLGCTHYPFLTRTFRKAYPVAVVDSAPAIARYTKRLLRGAHLLRTSGSASVSYWTTGNPHRFSDVASRLLRRHIRAKKARI